MPGSAPGRQFSAPATAAPEVPSSPWKDNMIRSLSAEAFGTFWLVLGGCGSAVLAAAFPEVGIGLLGVSLAFGLTVLTMAYAVGGISGGHFNPAVSLGLALAGRFQMRNLIPYC
jgi:aquaporin Z